MRKVKITEAYCVELGDVADIDRAHEESIERGTYEPDTEYWPVF